MLGWISMGLKDFISFSFHFNRRQSEFRVSIWSVFLRAKNLTISESKAAACFDMSEMFLTTFNTLQLMLISIMFAGATIHWFTEPTMYSRSSWTTVVQSCNSFTANSFKHVNLWSRVHCTVWRVSVDCSTTVDCNLDCWVTEVNVCSTNWQRVDTLGTSLMRFAQAPAAFISFTLDKRKSSLAKPDTSTLLLWFL